MNRLTLAAMLGLAVAGCVRTVPVAQRLQEEEGKCELIRTLLREPVPSKYVAEFTAGGREEPAPVMVFLRRPEEGVLERFFEGEPVCGDTTFRVVQQNGQNAVVLYLQETPEGYAYDAQLAGPEGLSLEGEPRGMVRRGAGGSWVAATN